MNKRGFTLLELMVAIVVIGTVLLSFTAFVINLLGNNKQQIQRLETMRKINLLETQMRQDICVAKEIFIRHSSEMGFMLKIPQKNNTFSHVAYSIGAKEPHTLYRSEFIAGKLSKYTIACTQIDSLVASRASYNRNLIQIEIICKNSKQSKWVIQALMEEKR